MLCDVVRRRRRRRRWAHAPVIHAASHFDHKKRVAWVSISMHTCGSFFYNYGAPLGGPSGRRSSAKKWGVTDFVLERTCPEEHLNVRKLGSVSEGHSGCKSQTIAIRALRGNVLCQMWFK